MLKYYPIIKSKKQVVLLLVLLLCACNGKSNQQTEKKASDTIGINPKVKPVKKKTKIRQTNLQKMLRKVE